MRASILRLSQHLMSGGGEGEKQYRDQTKDEVFRVLDRGSTDLPRHKL